MAFSASTKASNKFFINQSTITLPSYPSLKYSRAIASTDKAVWFYIGSSPAKNEHTGTKDKEWSPAAITEWEEHIEGRYVDSFTKNDNLAFFIHWNDEVVGMSDLTRIDQVKTGVWNAGLYLNQNARRKGIATVTMRVMVQLVWDYIGAPGERVECGTMKSNTPFRGVMNNMGLKEIDEPVVFPGRGLVAEVMYKFENKVSFYWP